MNDGPEPGSEGRGKNTLPQLSSRPVIRRKHVAAVYHMPLNLAFLAYLSDMMKPMNSTTACASSIGPFSHAQLIGMIYDTGMIATRYTIPIIVMIFILDDIDDHSYLISTSSERFFMIAI